MPITKQWNSRIALLIFINTVHLLEGNDNLWLHLLKWSLVKKEWMVEGTVKVEQQVDLLNYYGDSDNYIGCV